MPYESGFKPGLFAHQKILVAGGGGGLGRCIAHELASLGATVVLVGRTLSKLERVAEEITADGGQVEGCFAIELRDEDAVISVVSEILKTSQQLHGLVNAAGGQFPAELADLSLNGWNAVMHNNLTSYFLLAREVYNQHFCEHGGNIVNIGADYDCGMPGMGHNGAARAGLSNFTQTASSEWGRNGVRVNCVIPGFIATTGLDRYPEEDWQALTNIGNKVPLGRHGNAAEISAMVVFLLSPMASYVSGADFRVDGAFHNGASSFVFRPGEARNQVVYNGFHRDEPPQLMRAQDDSKKD